MTVQLSFAQGWTELTSGTNQYFYSVQFPSENIGFASSWSGLFKTTDAGSNWQLLSGNIGVPCYFTNTQTGYAINANGVQKTTDGGSNWTQGFVPTQVYRDMYFMNDNVGFATGSSDLTSELYFMKTTDGGSNWTESIIPNTFAFEPTFFFTSETTGFVGTTALILKTTDGGNNWVADTIGTSQFDALDVWDIHFPTADIGYACGMGAVSQIYKTTDAGETWIALNTDAFNTNPYSSIFFISADTGFATTGSQGWTTSAILKTVNGGASWSMTLNNCAYIESLYFPTSNTGYAAGENGAIYKYSTTIGIEDISDSKGISIYPNPATNTVTIENQTASGTYQLQDITGKVLLSGSVTATKFSLDISALSKGIYLLSLIDGEQQVNRKIVKE